MAIKCPHCGFDNPAGMKFCGQCATPLANLCPNCGFENPPGFKFCGSCGHNLLAATVAKATTDEQMLRRLQSYIPGHLVDKILQSGKQIEGERRNVAVLFSDIIGFTALSEKLDPEQVYLTVDNCFKAFVEEIYKYEGTVDKFVGDAVMALFGAPIAHENDPERAVRAALGMQVALDKINQDLEQRLGVTLKMRIGINSGLVVVGSVGADLRMDYTVMGDTVNIASRLEQVAAPDTIFVSRSVYEATTPLFEYQALEPVLVKGKSEPLEVYQVVGLKRQPGRVRGIRGLQAPLVGRDNELTRLKSVADELITQRQGQIVLVTGDAGIGKSRLTEELKRYLSDKDAMVLEGACLAYTRSISYWVFQQILKAYLGLTEEDTPEAVRGKIETKVKAVAAEGWTEISPFVAHLLAVRLDDEALSARLRHLAPAQLRQQTFLAVRDLLAGQAQQRPLVLIFEDLHWVDKPSLDLLLFLLNAVEQVPMMIYCISRPLEGQAAPQISKVAATTYATHYMEISLSKLSATESTELVGSLLPVAELPSALQQMISDRAEGNPFYLEEMIRMLIDRGFIRRANGQWKMSPDADLRALEVPTTLQGLILARVDALDESLKNTLQSASVIGRIFQYNLLARVREGGDGQVLRGQLHELQDYDLIRALEEALELEYIFKHVLTQETVYGTLLIRKRQKLHQRVAEALEDLYQDRLDEHAEVLAYHYAAAQVADKALPYLIRSGRKAAERYANEVALAYYRQALDFLTADRQERLEERLAIYMGLGDVRALIGEYEQALQDYQEALTVLRRQRGPETHRQIAQVSRKMGRVYERAGDYEKATLWLNLALSELAQDSAKETAIERARVHNDMGWVHYRQGQFDLAHDWAMRCLTILEGTDNYNDIGSAYNRLVGIYQQIGDWLRAKEYAERGLKIREKIGDAYGVGASYRNLGGLAAYLGEWEQSRTYLEKSLEIGNRIGYADGIGLSYNNLGHLYELKGEPDQAAEYLQKSLQIAERIGNAFLVGLVQNNLGRVAILRRDWAAALNHLEKVLKVATEIGSKEHLAEAHWLLGETHLGQGNLEKAAESCERSLELSISIGSKVNEGSAHRVLGMVKRAQGEWKTAKDHLDASIEIFTRLSYQLELGKSFFHTGLLHRDMGRPEEAREFLEKALTVFWKLGAKLNIQQTQEALAQIVVAQAERRVASG